MTLTLGVLLLLLGLCQSAIPEDSWSSRGHLDDSLFELPTQEYETRDFSPSWPISGLFNMVYVFIQMVQPMAFPKDMIRTLLQKKFELSMDYGKPESVVLTLQVVQYELRILLCALVGLLFAALMPLAGLCFGLCRSMHRCGGEMHQCQRGDERLMRKQYGRSFLVLCVLISIGIIYGFAASDYLETHTRKIHSLADSNFRDLRTFLNETDTQLNYVLAQFNTTKNRAFSDLDNIKTLLGDNIMEQIKPRAFLALDNMTAISKEIEETGQLLFLLNQDVWMLWSYLNVTYGDLTVVKGDVENTLNDPLCNLSSLRASCDAVRSSLGKLDGNTDLNKLRLLSREVDLFEIVLQGNLTDLIQMGSDSINNIPERVQNQTTDTVADLKRAFDDIGLNIKAIKQKVPIQEKLSVLWDHIYSLESNIYRELPMVKKLDSYRWLSCLIIFFFLTLIMSFYFLGLLCGVFGYQPKATPTTRGCASNTGGIFLMAGVGVSFFSCWMLMLFVTFTFVIGANVVELVCEPYQNKELFEIMDTPYLLNEDWKYYLSGMILDKPDINITFEQVYRSCKNNEGFYTALQLEHIYNVSEHLNVKEHIRHLNTEFKKIKLNLDIVLLSSKGRQSLNFSDSGVEQINYDNYLTEISKWPAKMNLSIYATDLKAQSNKFPPGNLKVSLELSANRIRNVYHHRIQPLEQQLEEVHQKFKKLQKNINRLKVRMTNLIDSLDSTQEFITNNLPSIIMQETKVYAATIISYFEHYLNWAKTSVTRNIAACKPLATALDSAIDVFLCKYITEPMNLLWFGIGQATILLLPAIIIAVKLAKYYRRMDSEDVYEDDENMAMKNLDNSASQPL